jgi:hypothetical protein
MESIRYITNGLKIVKNDYTKHEHTHKNIQKNIQNNVYNIYNINTDLPGEVQHFLESLDGIDEIKLQLSYTSDKSKNERKIPKRSSLYVKFLSNFTSHRQSDEFKDRHFISHQELLDKMGPEFSITEFVIPVV